MYWSAPIWVLACVLAGVMSSTTEADDESFLQAQNLRLSVPIDGDFNVSPVDLASAPFARSWAFGYDVEPQDHGLPSVYVRFSPNDNPNSTQTLIYKANSFIQCGAVPPISPDRCSLASIKMTKRFILMTTLKVYDTDEYKRATAILSLVSSGPDNFTLVPIGFQISRILFSTSRIEPAILSNSITSISPNAQLVAELWGASSIALQIYNGTTFVPQEQLLQFDQPEANVTFHRYFDGFLGVELSDTHLLAVGIRANQWYYWLWRWERNELDPLNNVSFVFERTHVVDPTFSFTIQDITGAKLAVSNSGMAALVLALQRRSDEVFRYTSKNAALIFDDARLIGDPGHNKACTLPDWLKGLYSMRIIKCSLVQSLLTAYGLDLPEDSECLFFSAESTALIYLPRNCTPYLLFPNAMVWQTQAPIGPLSFAASTNFIAYGDGPSKYFGAWVRSEEGRQVSYFNTTQTGTGCIPGTFKPQAGDVTPCLPCPVMTYQPNFGASVCLPCEDGQHCPAGTSRPWTHEEVESRANITSVLFPLKQAETSLQQEVFSSVFRDGAYYWFVLVGGVWTLIAVLTAIFVASNKLKFWRTLVWKIDLFKQPFVHPQTRLLEQEASIIGGLGTMLLFMIFFTFAAYGAVFMFDYEMYGQPPPSHVGRNNEHLQYLDPFGHASNPKYERLAKAVRAGAQITLTVRFVDFKYYLKGLWINNTACSADLVDITLANCFTYGVPCEPSITVSTGNDTTISDCIVSYELPVPHSVSGLNMTVTLQPGVVHSGVLVTATSTCNCTGLPDCTCSCDATSAISLLVTTNYRYTRGNNGTVIAAPHPQEIFVGTQATIIYQATYVVRIVESRSGSENFTLGFVDWDNSETNTEVGVTYLDWLYGTRTGQSAMPSLIITPATTILLTEPGYYIHQWVRSIIATGDLLVMLALSLITLFSAAGVVIKILLVLTGKCCHRQRHRFVEEQAIERDRNSKHRLFEQDKIHTGNVASDWDDSDNT